MYYFEQFNYKNMPKEKNIKNNKTKVENIGVEDVDITEEHTDVGEVEETLSEDVKEALGMNKAEKAAKIKEVDYISELENSLDGFDLGADDSKPGFDDFDSDME
jgi:hypothetical protein